MLRGGNAAEPSEKTSSDLATSTKAFRDRPAAAADPGQTECAACGKPLREAAPLKVMFLYLGRTGAGVRFSLELARAAIASPKLDASIVISHQNEGGHAYASLPGPLTRVPTFGRILSFAFLFNIFAAKRVLLARVEAERPDVVVNIMPHIWTPILARSLGRRGIRYVTMIHDAVPHPGDNTAFLTPWLLSETRSAELVVTLSKAVAKRLAHDRRVDGRRVLPLFHPDLNYGSPVPRYRQDADRPLRILFFGRIMAYKGLPTLVEAVRELQAQGITIELGVAGAGNLETERAALEALGAEIINRWFSEDEIGPLLSRYDVMALSHKEASQSGVASVAFASGMPVVAMPVGGLIEQVIDGETGVLAKGQNSTAFAAAIRRLADSPTLYNHIVQQIRERADARSATVFIEHLVTALDGDADVCRC